MKTTKFLKAALCTGLLLGSCQLNQEQENLEQDASHFFVNAGKAAKFASVLNTNAPYQSKEDGLFSKKKDKKISKTIEVIDSKHKLPAYYIFNYANDEGFAVVSADLRGIPVLAYADSGQFPDEGQGINSALAGYVKKYKNYISDLRDKKNNNENIDLWLTADAGKVIIKDPCDIEPELGCGDDDDPIDLPTISTWGPYLQSTWGQGCGYNSLLPDLPCAQACWTNQKPWSGCVPVAFGQIMRYWKHPARYDWNSMANGDFAGGDVPALLRDFGNSANTNYGCTSSSTNPEEALTALKEDFSYANNLKRQNYDYANLKESIKKAQPVYLEACTDQTQQGKLFTWNVNSNCHAWVADGLQSINYDTYSVYTVHMNWGWGNNGGNGWYTSWSNNGDNYQYGKKMITDIRPE